MLVILNDNDMSIAPAVGAMSAYLSQIVSSRSYCSLGELAKQVAKRFRNPSSAPHRGPRSSRAGW